MAASASTPVSAKMPGTPIARCSSGPATSDTANVAPIVMPIDRHRARAHVVAREVGGQRDHRRGNGARALQRAADDRPSRCLAPQAATKLPIAKTTSPL